jgi:alkanesulfonate monooxygenase SsuD/methylene tetrahydromethanopterin reductase-like flavin-dependent oxidoreductase (luciferase family)/hemerythrin-like domain-containing protein
VAAVVDYGHKLLFGTFVTPSSRDAEAVVALAQLAEQAALDLVTFQDHPYQPAFLDTWTLLSYVAARTSTVRLAPNVANLPLRQPAVLARSVASLDILSAGRVELGLGAGAFWEGVEAMGGRRRAPRDAVDALTEAIEVIRAIWDTQAPGGVKVAGEHYRVVGAKRGPAPAHDIEIWLGAYGPRMLQLTGRAADGWLPSLGYISVERLADANAVIDDAAQEAGRSPGAVRRLLNVGGRFAAGRQGFLHGPPAQWIEELTELALTYGIGTFITPGDDPGHVRRFALEVAPAVRDAVDRERLRPGTGPTGKSPLPRDAAPAPPGPAGDDVYAGLGVTPTPDDGMRRSARLPWDESTRPQGPRPSPDATYSSRGRAAAQHLVDVHDHLRAELEQVRELVDGVRQGSLDAGRARSAINEMTMRQNSWTMGAYCASYCRIVTGHHTLEDEAIFPHLRRERPLAPVIERLTEEHVVIHEVLDGVDRALAHHLDDPEDFTGVEAALDLLTDTLLSHLAYEERELVEPLARLGFYPGQLRE